MQSLKSSTIRLFSTANTSKLWGGRFTGSVDPLMEKFNASIDFDKKMWLQDVEGSVAYAESLQNVGLLNKHELAEITRGMEMVKKEWEANAFVLKANDEDIHTANERRLTEIIGTGIAGKLHTGRSRNDQVATDVRLWLRAKIDAQALDLKSLIKTTVARAKAESHVLMPGYTHLQPAQPIRWSHWLLAHCSSWTRDYERLMQVRKRVNVMPLGSGAIAGHAFFGPEERRRLAKRLGFEDVSMNSMDATSDRDFICDYLYWASLCGIHLSRWSEDVIIYATKEFGYLGLSDAYSTGSSLMPQKKNPDASELLRGKSARNVGNLIKLLTLLKGLPMTYNKDLQEDKEPLFDCVDTMSGCLPIATGVMSTLKVNESNMLKGLSGDMLATDLADYLVRKGVPFRETHHVAGRAVRLADEKKVELTKLTVGDLKSLHSAFGEDAVEKVFNFKGSVESRNAEGSTSLRSVLEQCEKIEKMMKD